MKPMLLQSLALGVCALAVAACSSNNNADTVAETVTADTTSAMAPGDSSAMAPGAAAATPAAFLDDAIKDDNAEVRFGQKAATMGSTPAVRDYGKMLASDHAAHKTKLVDLAKTMNVPVPVGTTAEADKAFNMATSMSGQAFDRDFAAAMVKDHQAAIAKYEKVAAGSNPPDLAKLANDTLPTLRKHLETAQQLSK